MVFTRLMARAREVLGPKNMSPMPKDISFLPKIIMPRSNRKQLALKDQSIEFVLYI